MMTPKDLQWQLAQIRKSVEQAKRDALRVAGNDVASLFRKNFEDEGFFGQKWKEVKRREQHTITYKTKMGTVKVKTVPKGKGAAGRRKILHGQGRNLSRSLRVRVDGTTATIYSDVAYAKVHNEGGRAGRGNGFQMPKRQFMGEREEVEKTIKKAIEAGFNKAFNP
jgi:phage gpG-like protein